MNPPVNVALVGICGYGASYLDLLLDAPPADGYRFVAAVDPDARRSVRIGELYDRGIGVYAELPALFAAHHIDLTLLCTPIHLHAPQTCISLMHGSNVLTEKPLSTTVEDGVRVEAAEARYGLFVAVGYQWSFSRAVQALKRDVMAGVLGRPMRLRTIAMFPRGDNYYGRNAWAGRVMLERGERVFDSPLNNAAAHYLHNMLYVLGATPQTSDAATWLEAELYRANDIESFDTAAVRVRAACGAELLFYATHAVPERVGPVCRFEFERAVVDYDHGAGGRFVARFDDGRVVDYGQPERDRNAKVWQCIEAVRTGAAVACGPRAAMAHTQCVAAARASSPAVVDFPADLRRRGVAPGEGPMTWINGLAETLVHCYKRGILPSEDGCGWAVPGRRIAITPAAPGAAQAAAQVVTDDAPRNIAAAAS
jgi:predicted dehydrogenase